MRLEALGYSFLAIPPMYVFVNEILLLSGKLGVGLAIFTLIATYAILYVSILDVGKYLAKRINDEIKAIHASGFLHIFSFSLAFIRAVQRTASLSIYSRLLTVRAISLIVPLIVTFFRLSRRWPDRYFAISSRLPFLES